MAGILTTGMFYLQRLLIWLLSLVSFLRQSHTEQLPNFRFLCVALKVPATFIMQLYPCNAPCIINFFPRTSEPREQYNGFEYYRKTSSRPSVSWSLQLLSEILENGFQKYLSTYPTPNKTRHHTR